MAIENRFFIARVNDWVVEKVPGNVNILTFIRIENLPQPLAETVGKICRISKFLTLDATNPGVSGSN
jgi:hypothetical protein